MVRVDVQEIGRAVFHNPPHGDGLPGEEVDFAPRDAVFGLDAAAVVSVGLWALWCGGGVVFVGERPRFGPGAWTGRNLRPGKNGRANCSCRGAAAASRCRSFRRR